LGSWASGHAGFRPSFGCPNGEFQAVGNAGTCLMQPDGTDEAWNPRWGMDAWNVPLAAASHGGSVAKWMKT
jgi:hypothetical protein